MVIPKLSKFEKKIKKIDGDFEQCNYNIKEFENQLDLKVTQVSFQEF